MVPHVRLFTPHGDVDLVAYDAGSPGDRFEQEGSVAVLTLSNPALGPEEVAASLPGLELPIRVVPVRSGLDENPNPVDLELDRRALEKRLTAEFGADRFVRAAVYPASRRWVMPAFGIQGELTPEQVEALDVVATLTDSGLDYDGRERCVRIRPVQETCSMSRVVGGGLCERHGGPYGGMAIKAHVLWQQKHQHLADYLGYSCGRSYPVNVDEARPRLRHRKLRAGDNRVAAFNLATGKFEYIGPKRDRGDDSDSRGFRCKE